MDCEYTYKYFMNHVFFITDIKYGTSTNILGYV